MEGLTRITDSIVSFIGELSRPVYWGLLASFGAGYFIELLTRNKPKPNGIVRKIIQYFGNFDVKKTEPKEFTSKKIEA